jgi:DNA-binding transcriptional LysR family regulator
MAMTHVDALDSLRTGALKADDAHDVSVVSAHDLIPHTLLRIVRAFRSRYPDAQISIRSGLSRDIRRAVADGISDVGFVSRPVKSPELEYHRLFSYEHVLITPPGHPLLDLPQVTLGDIALWPLILTQPGRFTRELLETEFRRLGHDYDVVMALPDMDMIKPYVAMGLGVSVGDSLAIEPEDERELGVVSLADVLPVEEAGFVTLRGAGRYRPLHVVSSKWAPRTPRWAGVLRTYRERYSAHATVGRDCCTRILSACTSATSRICRYA